MGIILIQVISKVISKLDFKNNKKVNPKKTYHYVLFIADEIFEMIFGFGSLLNRVEFFFGDVTFLKLKRQIEKYLFKARFLSNHYKNFKINDLR